MEKIVNWAAIIFVPVVLFVLTPIWSSLFKEEKLLQYSIVHESSILGHGISIDDWPELEFRHGDKKFKSGKITILIVTNTGEMPIKSSDFESPISISFKTEGKIYGHKIKGSMPEKLPVSAQIIGNTLVIDPLLLNPSDGFFVEILSETNLEIDNAFARVVGIGGITELERKRPSGLFVNLVKPSGPGSTRQMHVQELNTLFLVITSFIAAISTFIFAFVFVKTKRIIGKIVFGTISLNMYMLSLKGSALIPEALIGFAEKRWMDYVSMFGVLVFGWVAAIWIRTHLKEALINTSQDSK